MKCEGVGMKILLVEDDANARECMTVLLEKCGYAVECAGDGSEGLEKARLALPDLVISDVMMPEMDGFLLCRRIKEDPRLNHIPVILYTGTVMEKNEDKLALSMGASRFISKPAEFSLIIAAVKEELEKGARAPSAQVPGPGAFREESAREYLSIFSRKLQRKEAELREARKSLAESEERYRVILESAPEPMIIHRDGIFLYLNPAAVRLMIAEKQEQFVGRSLLDVVAPEHRDFIRGRIRDAGMGERTAPLTALKLVRSDGAVLEVEFIALPTVYQGNHARHVMVRDMSEANRAAAALRASEEKYRKIFENFIDVFYRVDMNGRISEVSPSATRRYGYTRAELIGMPMSMLYSDISEREKLLKKLSETGEVNDYELVLKDKNGALINAAISAHWILGSAGKPEGIEGTLRDVTERKRAEEALRVSQAQVLRSQKLDSIGQLTGGIAHDLNNLLGPVLGYADILRKSLSEGDPRLADLDEITKAAHRAATLIRQLLAFSRRQVMEPRVVNLNDTIGNIGGMLRRVIGERLRLRYILAPDLACVKVDPGQMEQVILNLVLNARDAMPSGGDIIIETSAETIYVQEDTGSSRMLPNAYAKLTVKDSGCGMDAAVKARLYEPFFTTKPMGKGTGLGLSTAYGIVKQSGGYMKVESEPGKGSIFSVYLPVLPDKTPVEADEEPAVPCIAGKGRVLLVEDDESMRGIARRILSGAGFVVSEAADGKQALRILAELREPVAFMITDLVMPEMDGLTLVQAALSKYPGLRILCMSGYSDKEEELEKVIGSRADYLQKPFDPDTLLRKVGELLK